MVFFCPLLAGSSISNQPHDLGEGCEQRWWLTSILPFPRNRPGSPLWTGSGRLPITRCPDRREKRPSVFHRGGGKLTMRRVSPEGMPWRVSKYVNRMGGEAHSRLKEQPQQAECSESVQVNPPHPQSSCLSFLWLFWTLRKDGLFFSAGSWVRAILK